jgi:predicted phosphodiesterase
MPTPDRRQFLAGSAAALAPLLLPPAAAESADPPAGVDEKFYIPPYLCRPTPDGMTVCFASVDAQDVAVQWGRTADALNETTVAQATALGKVTWQIWKGRLTDLRAGETIFYRVTYREHGEAKSSETYRFQTIDPQADAVRAVIYNDVHDHIETITALVKWVRPDDFSFSILLGDMWDYASVANNARGPFLNLEAFVRLFDGSNKPLLFVRGNHDVRGSFSRWLSHLFDFPPSDTGDEMLKRDAFYDLRVGPVWFIAPDSGEDGWKELDLYGPYRERQAQWLARILAESPHRSAPWRVLPTHIPLYFKGYWDAPQSRELWHDILADGQIDVSIAGHIHDWSVILKDVEIVYVDKQGTPEEKTIRQTPPFPTFIGGGPGLPKGTVTFLEANAKHLQLRAVNTQGKEVLQFALDKK